MNLGHDAAARVERYLAEVEAQVGDRPASVRKELIGQLRAHIEEALKQRAPGGASLNDVEAVLETMDSPGAFGGQPSAPAPAAEPPRRAWANRWFALAVGFLLVNAWGIWSLHNARGPSGFASVESSSVGQDAVVRDRTPVSWHFSEPMVDAAAVGVKRDSGPIQLAPPVQGTFTWSDPRTVAFVPDDPWPACMRYEATLVPGLLSQAGRPVAAAAGLKFQTPSLELLAVEQVSLSGDREATLRLIFNAPPERKSIEKFLHLSTPAQDTLDYDLQDEFKGNVVLIETCTAQHDEVHAVVEPGLPAEGRPLASAARVERLVTLSPVLKLSSLEPSSEGFEECSLTASFTAGLDMSTAESCIEVNPPVRYRVMPLQSWRGSGCVLQGEFKPGAIYTVSFRKDLRAAGGSELGETVSRVVQFPDRRPSLAFATSGQYLSPRGRLAIPVSSVNLREFSFSAAPVLPVNLVQLAARQANRYSAYYGPATEKLLGSERSVTNRVTDRLNEEVKTYVDLRTLLGPDVRGFFLLKADGERVSGVDHLVAVTDLGISARNGADGLVVWVNSLRDAAPAAGAEVTVYADNGAELAHGSTDADGLADLKLRGEDEHSEPFLVIARLGDDRSMLTLSGSGVAIPDAQEGRGFLADRYEAYVFTDRGVYRPGEPVHVEAVVRDRAMNCPEPFPALFRVYKPDGRVFKDIPITLGPVGTAETCVTIPDYLQTGAYNVQLCMPGTYTVLGEQGVSVEDFAPPQIRVNIEGNPARAGAAPWDVVVSSQHLFGRAASGLKCSGRVVFEATPFRPKGWDGFVFGNPERIFSTIFKELGSGALDDAGRRTMTVTPSAQWRPPAAVKATLSATVVETSGRAVSAQAVTAVDVYPFYIGLCAANGAGHWRAGETQQVDVVGVLPDGGALTGAVPAKVSVARSQWSTVLRRRNDGRYEYESQRQLTTILEDKIELGGSKRPFAVCLPSSGEYLVQVTDPMSGASSALTVYATTPDQQWVSWSREKADTVAIAPDRKSYEAGDKARVLISAPFSGLALLTVESDRVLERRVIRLEKNTATVDLDIKQDYFPNVYCVVSLVRPTLPEAVWSAHRAIGAAPLRVLPASRALKVELAAPDVQRPQASLPVRVAVRDAQGQPVEAEVTVMAVDEAICMLTSHRTPDPLGFFEEARRLGVEGFDVYGDLMPVLDGETGAAGTQPPGGEGSALQRRLNPIKANRFKPLALWVSGVHTDAKGEAAVPINIPEFAGELRLMAVAVTRSQAGSSDRPVKVKRELVVQPALPRFLAPGDECRCAVSIFNESASAAKVALRSTCGGPLSIPEPTAEFELAAGGKRDVPLIIKAGPGVGTGVISFKVSGAGEEYAESIEVPVRPTEVAVWSDAGILKAGQVKEIVLPAGWLAGSVSQDAWCSGRPTARLGAALRNVVEYPYGCLEQTVSGAFPLLYLQDLAAAVLRESGPAGVGAPRLQNPVAGATSVGSMEVGVRVQSAVYRILAMQQGAGSFVLWPRTSQTAEWASLYATHFLLEAKKAGQPVPEDRLRAALQYAKHCLEVPVVTNADPANRSWQDDMERRAYACHILALAGEPNRGWNARLREDAARLRFSSRVHTAAALLRGGEPRLANELLRQTGLPPGNTPRETDGNLNSPVRDAALLLSAWMDADPSFEGIPKLVRQIESACSRGRWMTTQDNAMALLALGKYLQRTPAGAANFAGLITWADGRTTNVTEKAEVRTAANPGEDRVRLISNDGPGDLFYAVQMEGSAAAGTVKEEDAGIAVRREWLSMAGERLPSRKLAQGDLVVFKLTVDTGDRSVDNLAIEDLLPAGFEIENPNLATSQSLPWMNEKSDWCIHREIRDDRLVLFTGALSGRRAFYYAARAVTAGTFVVPPVVAECMYDPETRSVNGAGRVEITR